MSRRVDDMAGETFGKYLVIRRLAMGGMAEVALARLEGAAGFNKLVVVKHVLPHLAQDPDFIDMFLDEGRLAARLMHPNIAQTFELGESDGRYFMAMEYVRGKTLTELFRRARELQVKVPLAVALRVAMLLLEALQYAHALKGDDGKPLGLVHRDVSPGNVMVTFDGAVKLLDFGIAKAVTQSHHTETGRVKGKAGFMSPEQCRGHALDARSDLYSAGAILYQLVTGARPYESQVSSSELYALMLATLKGGFDRPTALRPELPAELDTIISKAMALEVGDRYPSAAPLLVELEALCARLGTFPSAQRLADLMDQLFGDDERGELSFDPLAAARGEQPSQVVIAPAPSYPGRPARGPRLPVQRDPTRPPPPPPPDPEPSGRREVPEEPSLVEASAVLLSVDFDDEQATQAFPPMDLEDEVATRAFPPMDLSAEALARTELPPRGAQPSAQPSAQSPSAAARSPVSAVAAPTAAARPGEPAGLHAPTALALAQEAASLRGDEQPGAGPPRAQPAGSATVVSGPEGAAPQPPALPPSMGSASPSAAQAPTLPSVMVSASPSAAQSPASAGPAAQAPALPSVMVSPALTQAPSPPPNAGATASRTPASRLPAVALAALAAIAGGALWWSRSSPARDAAPRAAATAMGATEAAARGAGAPMLPAATDRATLGADAPAARTGGSALGGAGAPKAAGASDSTLRETTGAPKSASANDSTPREAPGAPTPGAPTDEAPRRAGGTPLPVGATGNPTPTSVTNAASGSGAPTEVAAKVAPAGGATGPSTPAATTDSTSRGATGAPKPAGTTANAPQDATDAAPPSSAMGQLKLDADPWAYVTWRGKTLGETPVSTQLPAGEQVLTLTNPELKIKRTVKLTIKAHAVTTHFERFGVKAP